MAGYGFECVFKALGSTVAAKRPTEPNSSYINLSLSDLKTDAALRNAVMAKLRERGHTVTCELKASAFAPFVSAQITKRTHIKKQTASKLLGWITPKLWLTQTQKVVVNADGSLVLDAQNKGDGTVFIQEYFAKKNSIPVPMLSPIPATQLGRDRLIQSISTLAPLWGMIYPWGIIRAKLGPRLDTHKNICPV